VPGGAQLEGQAHALVDHVADRPGRFDPVHAHPLVVLAHKKRGALVELGGDLAQHRRHELGQPEVALVQRAEEERLGAEAEGAVLEAAQIAELLEGFGEAQGGALVEADALRDLGEREALVGFAERVEDCQRAVDGRDATFIRHGLPHDCCLPLLGLSHAGKNPRRAPIGRAGRGARAGFR
jgi:hypothetical protein